MTPSAAGATGLVPGGSRRVWGCLEGCAELGTGEGESRERRPRGQLRPCPLVSPHCVPLCSLIASLSHLPLLPLIFPHLPLSSLTSFLSSLLPLLTSPHVLLSSPLTPRPSSPLVSPHCLSSSCPLLSPRHLPVPSPLVISPCLPSHPFTTCPLPSPCVPSPLPYLPFHLPCCPLAGAGPASIAPRLSPVQRGRGTVTHFLQLRPRCRRGRGRATPARSPSTARGAGTGRPGLAPLCPGPTGGRGQSWVSVCQAPDPPGVTVSPCPGSAGGDHGGAGSILLPGSIPVGRGDARAARGT